MKRIYFFDIDGTLLPFGHEIMSKETIYALKSLINNGSEVYIATGKSIEDAKKIADVVGIKNIISTNGQIVVKNEKIIYENKFSTKELEDFRTFYENNGVFIGLQGSSEKLILQPNSVTKEQFESNIYYTKMKNFMDSVGIDLPPIVNEIPTNTNFSQVWLFDERSKCVAMNEKYRVLHWPEFGADLVPITANKGNVIKPLLAEHYPDYENFAFGDGENDLEMLSNVVNGVAMGNATDEVKSFAKYECLSCEENGVYNYLVKLGHIKEMI